MRASIADAYGPDSSIRACALRLRAVMHAQTYGEAADASVLIPHMLEAFMAGDRGFKKGRTAKTAQ